MKTSHTPGPWSIQGDKIINEETIQYIADIRRDGEDDPEAQANARLIAAAPELLEALLNAQQDLTDTGTLSRETIAMFAPAIAKATAPATKEVRA